MNAKEALSSIADTLGEYQSFAEGFDHSDHGDQRPEEGETEEDACRFEQYDVDTALQVIADLIAAATDVMNDEDDARRGSMAQTWAFDIDRLADIVGVTLTGLGEA